MLYLRCTTARQTSTLRGCHTWHCPLASKQHQYRNPYQQPPLCSFITSLARCAWLRVLNYIYTLDITLWRYACLYSICLPVKDSLNLNKRINKPTVSLFQAFCVKVATVPRGEGPGGSQRMAGNLNEIKNVVPSDKRSPRVWRTIIWSWRGGQEVEIEFMSRPFTSRWHQKQIDKVLLT